MNVGMFSKYPDLRKVGKREWMIKQDGFAFSYRTNSGLIITPKDGFVCDFGSIPRFAWWWFYPTEYNGYPIHDWLYSEQAVMFNDVLTPITRAACDYIMSEAIYTQEYIIQYNKGKKLSAYWNWKRGVIYNAVKYWAWSVWNKDDAEHKRHVELLKTVKPLDIQHFSNKNGLELYYSDADNPVTA